MDLFFIDEFVVSTRIYFADMKMQIQGSDVVLPDFIDTICFIYEENPSLVFFHICFRTGYSIPVRDRHT